MKRLIFCAVCAAVLAGCASRNMTPDSMRGMCWSSAEPDCFELCEPYRDLMLEPKFANKKECRQACTDIYKRQASENAINRCEPSAANGVDLCNQYCNQNFGD